MRGDPKGLPQDCPVRPLGRNGDVYHFLNAAGQDVKYTAGQLAKAENLISLFSYGDIDPLDWLKKIGPPRRSRKSGDLAFNALDAATALIAACAAMPLFDPSVQIRKFGTWRGEGGAPLIHAGEEIIHPSGVIDRGGQMIAGAIYPATHGGSRPDDDEVDPDVLDELVADLREGWAWSRPQDPYIFLGAVAQATLGAYPEWRAHMWISGRHGSGKSTLLQIAHSLLGGMSKGIKSGSTEAAVRSRTNHMAIARLFDESEAEGESGKVEKLIELFRLMSGAEGATIERGSADHTGVEFRLYGAGIMASMIPGLMSPADRSRWVMLELGRRKRADDPAEAAKRLDRTRETAARCGPAVWRRMLQQAGPRWDAAVRVYSSLVQTLGGDERDGATIGAVLAGWDLLLYDGKVDDERLERAAWIAGPLIEDAKAAEEEGEGERCLRTILTFMVPKDTGGTISVNELIRRNLNQEPDHSDRTLLGRAGLRIIGAGDAAKLFVHGPQHPLLDRALAATRWRGGGHRRALTMLDGVVPSDKPVRVAGNKVRGVLIPKQYLPSQDD